MSKRPSTKPRKRSVAPETLRPFRPGYEDWPLTPREFARCVVAAQRVLQIGVYGVSLIEGIPVEVSLIEDGPAATSSSSEFAGRMWHVLSDLSKMVHEAMMSRGGDLGPAITKLIEAARVLDAKPGDALDTRDVAARARDLLEKIEMVRINYADASRYQSQQHVDMARERAINAFRAEHGQALDPAFGPVVGALQIEAARIMVPDKYDPRRSTERIAAELIVRCGAFGKDVRFVHRGPGDESAAEKRQRVGRIATLLREWSPKRRADRRKVGA